ncbi:hypothetical protein CH314_06415 [Lysinibacillus fusiformis]|nr:hypothetical protein CH314_06415 [Lysinibacillus fusiformis]
MFASNDIECATAINEHLEWANRHKKQSLTDSVDVFLIKTHIIMLLLEKVTINLYVIAKTHDSDRLLTSVNILL